jgi:hypothetical protein
LVKILVTLDTQVMSVGRNISNADKNIASNSQIIADNFQNIGGDSLGARRNSLFLWKNR